MQFQHFDIDGFLRDHWQKTPLLIRNPWKNWENPLEPDELAGLACESDVESRLIEKGGADWTVEHGPLAETRFSTLGNHPWTLLVQAVDHHVLDVAALLAPFRFVPNWRVDDVMVSLAGDQGGVGPHFDQYDVFLIQGLGQRRWRVGPVCNEATPLLPHADLRLLQSFEATQEWVLDPGDMLYVPPGFAHDGIAIGDNCMTYSIGFRAPSRDDLVTQWCDHLVEQMDEDDRYADPDLRPQDNPGEISAAALDRLYALATEQLLDRDAFARWFGEYNSAPKYPETDWAPEEPIEQEALRAFLADGVPLVRNPASRFAFVRTDGAITLFADGNSFPCTGAATTLAERICAQDSIAATPDLAASARTLALLAALIDQGSLAFEEEEEEE